MSPGRDPRGAERTQIRRFWFAIKRLRGDNGGLDGGAARDVILVWLWQAAALGLMLTGLLVVIAGVLTWWRPVVVVDVATWPLRRLDELTSRAGQAAAGADRLRS
jgi:hypothetical protein